jgi:hypothetical protein
MKQPTKAAVADLVRKYIQDRHPGGATLEVVDQDVRKERHWWCVPVRPSIEPSRRYEFYEVLADVETEMAENERVTVFLVPAAADAVVSHSP